MGKTVSAIVVILLLTLSARVVADNVRIRSSRMAAADVTKNTSGQGLRIELSFLAVTTLDEVSNERMSRLMARSFAEQAVSSFLKAEKAISFSRVKTVSCNFAKTSSGTTCSIVYEVPNAALGDAVVNRADSGADRKDWSRFVKACEQDGKYAMDDFRSDCCRDLRVAEAVFLYEIEQRGKDSDALRTEIEASLSAMCEKVNADDMLMMSEKDELVGKVGSVKSYLLKKLDEEHPPRRGVDAASDSTMLISQGRFRQEEYKTLLLSDCVLLTAGGCRIFAVGKKAYVVAVGCSPIADDSPEDRIRRKEVAVEKARTEVIKSRQTDVSYFSRSSSDTTVRHLNGEESSEEVASNVQTTTMKAADYVDSMDIVATWCSADGKMFYLALGAEVGMK